MRALLLALGLLGGSMAEASTTRPAGKVLPPKTPEGLPVCAEPLGLVDLAHRQVGETVRYMIDVNGLSVGTVDFKVEARGAYQGQPVTEFRSLFKLDSLVSLAMPVEGRAAAVVPEGQAASVQAMSHYKLGSDQFVEEQHFLMRGQQLKASRSKNGVSVSDQRQFPGLAVDFVTGFYLLRALPRAAKGCTLIYGNARAYTVWLEPAGQEEVKTPVGMKRADRYAVRYASDKGKKPIPATIWLSTGPDRLPYRALVEAPTGSLDARIQLYAPGSSAPARSPPK